MEDIMKLKLSSRFMRGIVSKLISKAIKKKFGYKVNIQLNQIDINIVNGETQLHIDTDVKLDSNEFKKIMSNIGNEEL